MFNRFVYVVEVCPSPLYKSFLTVLIVNKMQIAKRTRLVVPTRIAALSDHVSNSALDMAFPGKPEG